MNRVRLTYLLTTILTLGVIGIGWVVGISPLLTAASTADADRARIAADNTVLERRLAQLAQVRDELDEHRAHLDDLRRALPADGAYDAYLDEVYDLARAAGVAIDRVTFGDAAPFGTPAGAAPAPAPSETASSDPAPDGPAADPATSGAAADVTAPATTDTGTTDTGTTDAGTGESGTAGTPDGTATAPAPDAGAGLLSIPVQVGVTGPGDGVRRFIDALQDGDRYTLVTKVSLTSEEDAGDVLGVAATALLDGFVWALPE